MSMAFEAVVQDKMSFRRASEIHGVPKSTLQDRVSGKVQPGAVSGMSHRYLSDLEEEELGCARVEYPKNVKQSYLLYRTWLIKSIMS